MSIEELKDELAKLKSRQKSVYEELDALDRKGSFGCGEKVSDSNSRIHREMDLKEELGHIEADIAELEALIQERKTFKKTRFLENFKKLLAKSDIRIGQIEAEAGVSPGYISRLDKEGKNTDPSIEFIATAAKLLGVTVDLLLNGEIEELTETEQFLLDFIDKLEADTRSDTIVWREVANWSGNELDDREIDSFDHPMYGFKDHNNATYLYYYSRYGEDVVLSTVESSYSVCLPNGGGVLYLMACERDSYAEAFYELYLYVDNEVNPICNTSSACKTIKSGIHRLCDEVEESMKRIHIPGNAVDAIYRYLRGPIESELPFK